MNVNAKYDDDKMIPFMSDRCECELFVELVIPSYTVSLQSSTCIALGANYTGPLISFVIHIRHHIHITYTWNLSLSVGTGCTLPTNYEILGATDTTWMYQGSGEGVSGYNSDSFSENEAGLTPQAEPQQYGCSIS